MADGRRSPFLLYWRRKTGSLCVQLEGARLRMLGISGLELQQELKQRSIFLPVVVLTAYARTPLPVRAIQAGAVTVLEKPLRGR